MKWNLQDKAAHLGHSVVLVGTRGRLAQLCLLVVLAGCGQSPTAESATPAAANNGSKPGTTALASTPDESAPPSPAADAPADGPQPSQGASFDCGKAKAAVERLICSDPEVSGLDGRLARAYDAASAAIAPSSKPQLLEEQRRWIRYTRDLCADVACLRPAYLDRIGILSANSSSLVNPVSCQTPAGADACVDVVTYRDPNSRIEAFNQLLRENGHAGKILGCRALIDLPAGTANGNHSFGGDCTLEAQSKRTAVKICNDEMVGNFAVEPVEGNGQAIKDLIQFTRNRCADA